MGDFHLVLEAEVWEDFAGLKVVVDLVKEVGISHSCSTYHDGIGADFLNTLFSILGATDITVSDERNLSQSLGHIVQGLKVSMTSIHLLTGAAMHSQGGDSSGFSCQSIFYS